MQQRLFLFSGHSKVLCDWLLNNHTIKLSISTANIHMSDMHSTSECRKMYSNNHYLIIFMFFILFLHANICIDCLFQKASELWGILLPWWHPQCIAHSKLSGEHASTEAKFNPLPCRSALVKPTLLAQKENNKQNRAERKTRVKVSEGPTSLALSLRQSATWAAGLLVRVQVL